MPFFSIKNGVSPSFKQEIEINKCDLGQVIYMSIKSWSNIKVILEEIPQQNIFIWSSFHQSIVSMFSFTLFEASGASSSSHETLGFKRLRLKSLYWGWSSHL